MHPFSGSFENLQSSPVHSTHETSQEKMDGFSWHLIFKNFMPNHPAKSTSIYTGKLLADILLNT
jgi:hypothetical protein